MRRLLGPAAILIVLAAWTPPPQAGVATGAQARVIVAGPDAEQAVDLLDGRILRRFPQTTSMSALVPQRSLAALRRAPGVEGVWLDARVSMSDTPGLEEYDVLPPNKAWRNAVGLTALPSGADGAGVTVAVLDTGLTRVTDLGDRVVARVDLTPDSNGYDRYGHGTHMSGIVAGDGTGSNGRWRGVAPRARIVSVKVAGWNGATDVSAVLAGLEWVAAHRSQYGIRVVNLSFGTDASQAYRIDPLDHAVERLWRAGVVVVAAAGNRGVGGSKIDKPGDDPFVLTVGAADLKGTAGTADDEVAPFSSRGPTHDGVAKPDVVAPGITIVSNRAAGSTIDGMRPAARVGSSYFKGTGTSQATAIVSGLAALVLEAAPSLTADEVKATLRGTTSPALAGREGAGAGLVHAGRAVAAAKSGAYRGTRQIADQSSGLGPIDSSRGNFKVWSDLNGNRDPEQVSGEIDVFGRPWDPAAWASKPWTRTTWRSSTRAQVATVASGWNPAPAPVRSWSGMGWDETSWSAKSWREAEWTTDNWTAKSWRAANWN